MKKDITIKINIVGIIRGMRHFFQKRKRNKLERLNKEKTMGVPAEGMETYGATTAAEETVETTTAETTETTETE